MNDKDIENIQTVDITVTAESMDAHVQCLKDNGYKVKKPFALFTAVIENEEFVVVGDTATEDAADGRTACQDGIVPVPLDVKT